MKAQRKSNQKKKKNENKESSELKIFRTQSMLVSDNVSDRQCRDLVNVRIQLMSESGNIKK